MSRCTLDTAQSVPLSLTAVSYTHLLDEVGSWKRTEMQLRDDKAHVFAMTFKDRPLELGELAFGLLANNLRFVVQNRNESNKSRWKTCRFWERFLGAVEVLKLQVPKLHNSLAVSYTHLCRSVRLPYG